MKLIKQVVGPWSLNAYALICPQTRESLLIDPGADADALHRMLNGTRPKAILVTHGHPDHIGALHVMQRALKVPVLAYPSGLGRHGAIVADQWLIDDERLTVGKCLLRVVHTPGHTDDQICLDVQDSPIIIVGDTIFEGGPGRTGSAADFRKTLRTLDRTVLAWPDESVCYPGHGSSFHLRDKRGAIDQFLKKEHGEFFGDASWEM